MGFKVLKVHDIPSELLLPCNCGSEVSSQLRSCTQTVNARPDSFFYKFPWLKYLSTATEK